MSHLALIVIDMQRAYFQDTVLAGKQAQLIEKCNEIIRAAIQHHVPIWNIATEHTEDRSTWSLNMLDDDQGFLFHGSDEAHAVEGLEIDHVRTIIKTRDSAFYETKFEQELAVANIDTLLICGVSTQSCVFQTAADAYARNLRVVLASEAIATNEPAAHEFTLKLLQREYRQTIADNKELIALMVGTGS